MTISAWSEQSFVYEGFSFVTNLQCGANSFYVYICFQIEGRVLPLEKIFWGKNFVCRENEQADWGSSIGKGTCIEPVSLY